jgi:hypothetical protein
MQEPDDGADPAAAPPRSRYAFLTLPKFSLIAVADAVVPVRLAKRGVGPAG